MFTPELLVVFVITLGLFDLALIRCPAVRLWRWALYLFALLWGLLGGFAVRDALGAELAPTPAQVLAVLSKQPRCWADRKVEPAAKALQLATIAAAISEASPTAERAAYLLDIGWHESRWCLDVGSGARRGGSGEGYWQLEGAHHGPGARSGLGLKATSSAALLASAQLQRSRQCGPDPADVLTAYAGRPCWQTDMVLTWGATDGPYARPVFGWPTLESRVRGYWWALSALRRGQK